MGGQDGMQRFLAYHKQIFTVMALACAAAFAGFAVSGLRGDWSYAIGFASGAVAQLLKFGLVDLATVRRLASDGDAAAQLKSTLFSLFLFGLAVAAAHSLGGNIWALATGIFLPRVILVADAWIRPNPFGSDNAE